MGGEDNRLGLRYQDRYLLLRLLQEAGAQIEARLAHGEQNGRPEVRFGIEARPSQLRRDDNEAPAWDVTAKRLRELEAIEVKSGAIDRPDRVALWRRLRREMHMAEAGTVVIPVLVVDPDEAGTVKYLEAMPALAAAGRTHPAACPSPVTNGTKQLDEALWCLCAERSEVPAIPPEDALAALARLRIDPYPAEELKVEVARGVEGLFTNGLTPHLEETILGWLGGRAVSTNPGERFLTVEDLLTRMEIANLYAGLAPGVMMTWRELGHDLPIAFAGRVNAHLGRDGEPLEPKRTQPVAARALPFEARGGHLMIGPAGTGKTTLLAQYAEGERERDTEVFCAAADAVPNAEKLNQLFASLRFRRTLHAFQSRNGRFALVVDGLDEVNDVALREQWAKHLALFATGERTVVVATVLDSAWEFRTGLKENLSNFNKIPIDDWPEALVIALLREWAANRPVSDALRGLLRRALFFDIFWRTFVEQTPAEGLPDGAAVETRHGLLTAFWQQRVLGSRQRRSEGFDGRLAELLGHAAKSIGSFNASALDEATVAVLVHEGVLVREGNSTARYRFRHPLLRDHALAYWCLLANDPQSAAAQWRLVKGGLQAHGTLRAIFEALMASEAAAEHPRIDLTGFLRTLVEEGEGADALAQLLGTLDPSPDLDPAMWPGEVQEALPENFGRELLAAARSAANGAWAKIIRGWRLDARWLDERFAEVLQRYTDTLWQYSNQHVLRPADSHEGPDPAVRSQAQHAARVLRNVARHERFAGWFAENGRHHQMNALERVMMALSFEETFAWVEGELPVATWKTRRPILARLIDLAALDPRRAASIYRVAIGLERSGRMMLNPERWEPQWMGHYAIGVALGGAYGGPGLVTAHPGEFVPVVLDVIEAMSMPGQDFAAAGELWNDLLHYHGFWDREPDPGSRDSCLVILRESCGRVITENPARFVSEVAPLLRVSDSTAVQSIYLDALLKRHGDAEYLAALRVALMEPRLYTEPVLLHWLEEALRRCWPTLGNPERAVVLGLIEGMPDHARDAGGAKFARAKLLATVPAKDLPNRRLRVLRAKERVRTPHPRGSVLFSMPALTNSSDDPDSGRVESWPEGFDRGALRVLSRGEQKLSNGNGTPEASCKQLTRMVAAVTTVIGLLEEHPEVLNDRHHDWMWRALGIAMRQDVYRAHWDARPPRDLVARCAQLALQVLEAGAPTDPTAETFGGYPYGLVGPWADALRLANVSLGWPSLRFDEAYQGRLVAVIRAAFATGMPVVKVTVNQNLVADHWVRDEARHKLDDELTWNTSRNSAVLAAALHRVPKMNSDRCMKILRQLLKRDANGDAMKCLCSNVGHLLGQLGMRVQGGARGMAADLIDEVLGSLRDWALLHNSNHRIEFLCGLVSGMQRIASHDWRNAGELAFDYGWWNRDAWIVVRDGGGAPADGQHEITFTPLSWLAQNRPGDEPDAALTTRDPNAMRIWWEHLQPFCREVATTGDEDDLVYLLHDLQPGRMDHVLKAAQVFDWLDSLLDRLRTGLNDGTMALTRPCGSKGTQSWRDVLHYAVRALDALRSDRLLGNDDVRECAYALLGRMAAPPFDLDTAKYVMAIFRQVQT